jgi:hypothetical protein
MEKEKRFILIKLSRTTFQRPRLTCRKMYSGEVLREFRGRGKFCWYWVKNSHQRRGCWQRTYSYILPPELLHLLSFIVSPLPNPRKTSFVNSPMLGLHADNINFDQLLASYNAWIICKILLKKNYLRMSYLSKVG